MMDFFQFLTTFLGCVIVGGLVLLAVLDWGPTLEEQFCIDKGGEYYTESGLGFTRCFCFVDGEEYKIREINNRYRLVK